MIKPLRKKLSRYTAPQEAKAMGVYPYFREISSDQDAEVTMNGKKVLMLGSNSYLGLTNHPKIKEAAKAAINKYGTGCAGSPSSARGGSGNAPDAAGACCLQTQS